MPFDVNHTDAPAGPLVRRPASNAPFPATTQPITWTAIIKSIAAYPAQPGQRGLALRPLPARQGEAAAVTDARHGPVHGRAGRVPPLSRQLHLQRSGELRRGVRPTTDYSTTPGSTTWAGPAPFPNPTAASSSSRAGPRTWAASRPPSLRNVALTAPYMHDGSIATLEAGGRALRGGRSQRHRRPTCGSGATRVCRTRSPAERQRAGNLATSGAVEASVPFEPLEYR